MTGPPGDGRPPLGPPQRFSSDVSGAGPPVAPRGPKKWPRGAYRLIFPPFSRQAGRVWRRKGTAPICRPLAARAFGYGYTTARFFSLLMILLLGLGDTGLEVPEERVVGASELVAPFLSPSRARARSLLWPATATATATAHPSTSTSTSAAAASGICLGKNAQMTNEWFWPPSRPGRRGPSGRSDWRKGPPPRVAVASVRAPSPPSLASQESCEMNLWKACTATCSASPSSRGPGPGPSAVHCRAERPGPPHFRG